MKTLPKVLLITSGIAFVLSLTGPGGAVWFGIMKPVSALLFMAAFIVHIVGNLDPAEYAADTALRDRLIEEEKLATPKETGPTAERREEAFAS